MIGDLKERKRIHKVMVVLLAPLVLLECFPAAARGDERLVDVADVSNLIPDYDQYEPMKFLSVDSGTVKAQKVTDWLWRVVIEAPDRKSQSVQLSAKDFEIMRVNHLRPISKFQQSRRDSIRIRIPADGVAWLALFRSIDDLSLFEFRPRSQLHLADSTPQKAKFPVVDVHGHLTHLLARGIAAEERLRVMDEVGVAVVIDSPMALSREQTADSYFAYAKKHPNRFLTFSTIDFTNRREVSFVRETTLLLQRDKHEFGAVGIGETHDKGAGIFEHPLIPSTDALYIDDERLIPLWKEIAKLDLPILFHTGDPIAYYQQADQFNERLPLIQQQPQYRLDGLNVFSNAEIRQRRNRVLEQVPDLKVIAAHMDNLPEDLPMLSKQLDRYPNLYLELGVRHSEISRQPRAARKFFIKHQDRILFGADGAPSVEYYRLMFRILETDDDAFTDPRRRRDTWSMYGLDLPDLVLRKIYYANAAKLFPQVKQLIRTQNPELAVPD